MSGLPLGKLEGQRLEFKSAQAIENLAGLTIARSVAAMLNAEGGEIWIGVQEERETATALQSIPEPEAAVRRLWDHLIDVLEPKPASDALRIEAVPWERGVVLRMTCRPQTSSGPVAVLQKQARLYLIRTGARVRNLSREELSGFFVREASGSGAWSDPVSKGRDELRERLKDANQPGGSRFWLGARLVSTVAKSIDVYGSEVDLLLRDPQRIGVSGQEYASVVSSRIEETQRSKRPPHTRRMGNIERRALEVIATGTTIFTCQLSALAAPRVPGSRIEPHEVDPVVLMGMSASFARFTRGIFELAAAAEDDEVLIGLALTLDSRWLLRPGVPPRNQMAAPVELTDYQPSEEIREAWSVFAESPDRVGVRILARLYHDFGLRREDLPPFYDESSGRVTLWD